MIEAVLNICGVVMIASLAAVMVALAIGIIVMMVK